MAKVPRTITAACAQKQQQEAIGPSKPTNAFQRKDVTEHMCFTIESGPRCRGARTGTHRPSPSPAPAHKNEAAKSAPGRGEEEETIYIRSSMEEKANSIYKLLNLVYLGPFGSIWVHFVPLGPIWVHLVPFWTIWLIFCVHLGTLELIWLNDI